MMAINGPTDNTLLFIFIPPKFVRCVFVLSKRIPSPASLRKAPVRGSRLRFQHVGLLIPRTAG